MSVAKSHASHGGAADSHAHHGGHEHHWETSLAPLALVVGVVCLLPAAFISYFVYEDLKLASIFMGFGTPIVLFAVSKWVNEGMTQPSIAPGLAAVGLPLFIVSEIFIFLAMFAAYWMFRLFAVSWPPAGSPEMPTGMPLLMTALLVTSSVTAHVAEEKEAHGDVSGLRTWLMLTILLGLAFLSCTAYEYTHLIGHGFVPGVSVFSTAFFGITGFHASHVMVGLFAFLFVLIPAFRGRTNKTFLQCVSVYWHFVDVVWFFVVSQIYFW
ncbi:Heme-copper oxidase subunit III [Azospirillaceae bacterium]